MRSGPQLDEVERAVVDRLVTACPSFGPLWTHAVAGRVELGEEPTALQAASVLADHLLDLLLVARTEEFPAVFGAIEMILVEADPWLEEVFGLYFIEDLQAAGLQHGRWQVVDPFRRWLGPRTTEAWRASYYRWKSDAGFPPTT